MIKSDCGSFRGREGSGHPWWTSSSVPKTSAPGLLNFLFWSLCTHSGTHKETNNKINLLKQTKKETLELLKVTLRSYKASRANKLSPYWGAQKPSPPPALRLAGICVWILSVRSLRTSSDLEVSMLQASEYQIWVV